MPSAEPEVYLVNTFRQPLDNAVAAARTCYSSKGLVTPEEVSPSFAPDGESHKAERILKRNALAESIFQAGHHTVFQHAHFQFALANVSRHFIWTFLHAHPFYNSEQVSQRYVEVKEDTYAIPPLQNHSHALQLYEDTVQAQFSAYHTLIQGLTPLVRAEYDQRFPARKNKKPYQKDIKKKAQEVARYVLPLSTFAYLYHTVSAITLLRYYRLCEELDAPWEQKIVVEKMVQAVLATDPDFQLLLETPLPLEETLEYRLLSLFHAGHQAETVGSRPSAVSRQPSAVSQTVDCQPPTADCRLPTVNCFLDEFDRELEGKTSRLVGFLPNNETLVADGVREVLGLSPNQLSTESALELVLHPSRNPYLGETLNLLTLSKLSRALVHAHYVFKKKLSHTADSQDQRHRLTPASRPSLHFVVTEKPDYITPDLVRRDDKVWSTYTRILEQTWDAFGTLLHQGVPKEYALYVLPNALAVRFTQSTDLLNLFHKHKMRLCYNAQEEIWKASREEALQIREVNPLIGRHLLPPCTPRKQAGVKPFCPEGERFCGVPVWNLDLTQFRRQI